VLFQTKDGNVYVCKNLLYLALDANGNVKYTAGLVTVKKVLSDPDSYTTYLSPAEVNTLIRRGRTFQLPKLW